MQQHDFVVVAPVDSISGWETATHNTNKLDVMFYMFVKNTLNHH